MLLATSVLLGLAPTTVHATSVGEGAARSWPYWKTDLHAHSVASGDGTTDPGIIATYAKARGFNAVYLTDHQAASYNIIGGVVASHVSFDDDAGANRQWNDVPTAPTATATAAPSPEHALSGTNGYLVSASAGREAFGWIKRGPNLRSGQITARFSIYPTRIDTTAGLYFSFSLGGDATVPSRESDGYTTAGGTVLPGRSTTFVWQLGAARLASDDGTTRVITQPLDYTLDTWNTYTIDVTQAVLDAFPDPATRPGPLNGLLFMKMAASSSGGQATGWFDALSVDAANAPTKSSGAAAAAASDFVARNAIISNWDTPTFRLLPGMEMGGSDHAQRLHYPITDVSQWQQFPKGVAGIDAIQTSGYPAQLNHPGFPGGVTDEETMTNNAYGAEVIEADERGTNDGMIRDFDALLHRGEPLVGSWTSDSHRNATFGSATFLQAPVLSDGELLHSLFEGRAFLAKVDFPGTVSFAPDTRGGSYPARYPSYRSADDPLSVLRLQISTGIPAGSSVVWLRDGAVVRSDAVPVDGGYDGHLVLPLPTASTAVRAEVRRPDGSRLVMTEPVIMRTSTALPRGITAHLERVVTSSGAGYTTRSIPGIVTLAFDPTSGELTTAVRAPAGSRLLEVLSTGSRAPASVRRDGQDLPRAASRAALEATADEGWAFDEASHELVIQGTGQSDNTSLAVTLVAGSDVVAPSAPGSFTALALHARRVRLSWEPSQDDTGVVRYVLRRNGVLLTVLPADRTSYDDTSVSSATDYSYEIDAEDAASNTSARVTAVVRTQPVISSTVTALADTYANSLSPTTSYGAAKTMKADSSPELISFVRFPAPPTSTTVISATLKMTSTAALPSGVRVLSVSDHTWAESSLNWSNAPARGAQVAASTALVGGTESSTDVLAGIGSGPVDFAFKNPTDANVSLFTKESGTSVPRLVYETSTTAPRIAALSLTTQEDQPVTFTPVVGGGDGSALSCRLVTPPVSGSAWVAADCSSGEISPGLNFFGTDGFDVEVADGGQRVRAHARLDVTGVNDVPATDAEVLGASTDEDTPVTVLLQGSDVDGDCPLAFTIVSSPSHGRLGPLSDVTCAGGSASAATVYTPDRDFHGNDALSFQLTDPSGASSPAAGVGITVAAVNDPPVPDEGTPAASTDEDTPVTVTLHGTDVDGDCPLSFTLVATPSHGQFGPLSDVTCTEAGASATAVYTPDHDFHGSDALSFRVTDPSGVSSPTGGAAVTVVAVNDSPTADDVSVAATPGTSTSWVPLVADVDGDPLTCSLTTMPTKGTATVAGDCSSGSYSAAATSSGSDAFTYTVSDGVLTKTASGAVSITGPSVRLADGFESADLAGWVVGGSVTASGLHPHEGSYAADVNSSSGGPAFLKQALSGTPTTTATQAWVRVESGPVSGSTALLRFRGAADNALLTLSLDSNRRLKLRNEVTRVGRPSATALPLGTYALIEVRVTTAGSSSTVRVLVDGVEVTALAMTGDLGASRVAAVQLGDNARGPTGRFTFDDVKVTGE